MMRIAIITALILLGLVGYAYLLDAAFKEWKPKPPVTIEQLQEEIRRTKEILDIASDDRLRAWEDKSAIMRRYCGYIDHVAAIAGNPLMACLDSMAVVARAAGWTPPAPWEPLQEAQRSRP